MAAAIGGDDQPGRTAAAGTADGDGIGLDADGYQSAGNVMPVAGTEEELDPTRRLKWLGVIEVGNDEIGDVVVIEIDRFPPGVDTDDRGGGGGSFGIAADEDRLVKAA
ncbi:unannotated protein [freshwater metagenome]|uniref:Unannotated protein n=1 Tax=freshwater metagenome TaxID=449393 RepID=A0A6J7M3P5_9ZZZZ